MHVVDGLRRDLEGGERPQVGGVGLLVPEGPVGPLLVVADAAVDQDRMMRGAQQVALDREQERPGLRVHRSGLEPALVRRPVGGRGLGKERLGVERRDDLERARDGDVADPPAWPRPAMRCPAFWCPALLGHGGASLAPRAADILNSRCRAGPVARCPGECPLAGPGCGAGVGMPSAARLSTSARSGAKRAQRKGQTPRDPR